MVHDALQEPSRHPQITGKSVPTRRLVDERREAHRPPRVVPSAPPVRLIRRSRAGTAVPLLPRAVEMLVAVPLGARKLLRAQMAAIIGYVSLRMWCEVSICKHFASFGPS
jgi:hypothetical protein